MNNSAPEHPNPAPRNGTHPAAKHQSRLRSLGIAAILFLAGAGLGGWTIYHSRGFKATQGAQGASLSETTKVALGQLHSNVELRFYSLLQPAGITPEVKAFAGRLDQVLSAYEREANGRLKVTRLNSESPALQKSASIDGLKAFGADENNAAYLGIVLIKGSHRECLPLLAPEWEQALEPDLTRALLRLDQAVESPQAAVESAKTAAAEEVKRLVPGLETVSLEEASGRLREAALAEFKAAAAEMEKQVKEAQRKLADARSSGSEADQTAAAKNLQQVQAAQTEQIRQLAAKSRAQIEALTKLKTTAQ